MKVTDNIHALKIPFIITLPTGDILNRFVYVYVYYGNSICLIDSGVAGAENSIFEYINETDKTPLDIDILILSHAHPDHIGGAGAIKKSTGCAVLPSESSRPWIEDVDLHFKERPIPGFYKLAGGPTRVDKIISDGDRIKLSDNEDITILSTPGHSDGSVPVFFEDRGVLFSGDAVLHKGYMPVYSDYKTAVLTLEKLKKLDNIKILLYSWDSPKFNKEPYDIFDEGLGYLDEINKTVKGAGEIPEPMELCRHVIGTLGLPNIMVNPLVARSLMSHRA